MAEKKPRRCPARSGRRRSARARPFPRAWFGSQCGWLVPGLRYKAWRSLLSSARGSRAYLVRKDKEENWRGSEGKEKPGKGGKFDDPGRHQQAELQPRLVDLPARCSSSRFGWRNRVRPIARGAGRLEPA